MKYDVARDRKTGEIIGVGEINESLDLVIKAIPIDENNTDYAKYLAWVAEGNTTTERNPERVDTATREAKLKEYNWIIIRQQRGRLLVGSDWSQGADSPLSASKKTEWATYRQALRDIPTEQSDETEASDITWPTKPADE